MAWDPAKPTDSGLLINAPGQLRANWDAVALGTDASLLITNAKVSGSAAIVEAKLLFNGSGHAHSGGGDGAVIVLSTTTGTLAIARGGTNITSYTHGDVLYVNSSGNLAKLAQTTKGMCLTTNGPAADPGWIGMTTQGDIEYHNGTTRTRLPKGSADQVLTMNTGATVPEWADSQGGIEIFDTSGTWTCPTGITQIFVSAVGAGGGAGSGQVTGADICAGGGGGGETFFNVGMTVVPTTGYTVTIGAGGAGGTGQLGNGSDGGDTSFVGDDFTATAKGGDGCIQSGAAGDFGAGGVGVTLDESLLNGANASSSSTTGGTGAVIFSYGGGDGGQSSVSQTDNGGGGGSTAFTGDLGGHGLTGAGPGGAGGIGCGGGGSGYANAGTGGAGGDGALMISYSPTTTPA